MRAGRRFAMTMVAVLVVLVIAVALGPRVPVDTRITFDAAAIGNDPAEYLDAAEAAVPGIRDDLQKEIIWADPLTRAKTPLAIVYVHGFSASKGEIMPVADIVAAALDANLYYTRLTGHGRDGPAMLEGSVNAWVNDYAEALAIGRAIGQRVVVIATSTGASLALWAATQPGGSENVATVIAVSPNFGVRAAGSSILTLPWGGQVAEWMIGPERGFDPVNELHARYWTTRYPTRAILPMAALTDLAHSAPVEDSKVPALFIFSDDDKVVRSELTREIAGRWGAQNELVPVERNDDPSNHVIAGDALSPSTTRVIAGRMVVWIEAVTGAAN
jgi:pimeloyl-ACP methyl ester carboxylesterase